MDFTAMQKALIIQQLEEIRKLANDFQWVLFQSNPEFVYEQLTTAQKRLEEIKTLVINHTSKRDHTSEREINDV